MFNFFRNHDRAQLNSLTERLGSLETDMRKLIIKTAYFEKEPRWLEKVYMKDVLEHTLDKFGFGDGDNDNAMVIAREFESYIKPHDYRALDTLSTHHNPHRLVMPDGKPFHHRSEEEQEKHTKAILDIVGENFIEVLVTEESRFY